MTYYFTVKLTNDRSLKLREMTLREYKELQKICSEDSPQKFIEFSNTLIEELSIEPIGDLNDIDKFITLMMIKVVCVSEHKGFWTFKDGKKMNIKVSIPAIVEKVRQEYCQHRVYEMSLDHELITKVSVDPLNFEDPILKVGTNNRWLNDITYGKGIDIPLNLKSQIDDDIKEKLSKIDDLELFTLCTENGKENTIGFTPSKQFIYDLAKIFIKDDLSALYHNMYNLHTKVGISFSDQDEITYGEYELYAAIFNQEKQEEAKQMEDMKHRGATPMPKVG